MRWKEIIIVINSVPMISIGIISHYAVNFIAKFFLDIGLRGFSAPQTHNKI